MNTGSDKPPSKFGWFDSNALLPYCIACALPLGQLSANVASVPTLRPVLRVAIAALVIAAVIDLVLRSLFWLATSHRHTITALFVFAFFTLGHIPYYWVPGWISYRGAIQMSAAMLTLLSIGIARLSEKACEASVRFLKVVFTIVVIGQAFWLSTHVRPYPPTKFASDQSKIIPTPQGNEQLPDIYYIIFDAYGRQDVLQEMYGFDNEPFLSQLQSHGFTVLDKSVSNYHSTVHSIVSSLNMGYVQDFDLPDHPKYADIVSYIKTPRIDRELKKLGYFTISLDSGYSPTQRETSDLYLSWEFLHSELEGDELDKKFEKTESRSIFDLDDVETAVLQTTVASWLVEERLWIGRPSEDKHQDRSHRSRILRTFKRLPSTRKLRAGQPKFVFAHFVCPHPPFIFNADGSSADEVYWSFVDGPRPNYRPSYVQQLRFMNQQCLNTVDQIIDASSRPAIIILQSDHGPGSELARDSLHKTNLYERFSILNAIRFPDQDHPTIDRAMSPVNSLRLVLNYLTSTKQPLLETRSYFFTDIHRRHYTEVTSRVHEDHSRLDRP